MVMMKARDYMSDINFCPHCGHDLAMYQNNDFVNADNTVDENLLIAVKCVIEANKASTSLLQRKMRIGYGNAARLIETMEERGYIGPAIDSKPREVLIVSIDQM